MLKKWLVPKNVNYVFFAVLFLFLAFLTISHIPQINNHISLILYALCQVILEIGLCILIAHLIPSPVIWGGCFFLMLLHYTDFILVRVLDSTLIQLLNFFFASGVFHFLVATEALHLNLTMGCMTIGTILLIPIAGFLFYQITEKLSSRRPFPLSFVQITFFVSTIAIGLFTVDLTTIPSLSQRNYTQYAKALPFGTTLFKPTAPQLLLDAPLPLARDEKKALTQIPSDKPASLPNIYFFVIETLRRDYINEQTAPHLTAFSREFGEFRESFANANATHTSWFALFHSAPPYQWTTVRDQWTQGALSFQWLKQLGYKIRVYAAADFRYFDMDQVLFGKNRQLVDHIEEYTKNGALKPCDRDLLALQSACRDVEDHRTGTVFLVFLDSTHSEYSVPKDWPCRFLPIIKQIDYLTIQANSACLSGLKNRYRNSIDFVDTLVGNFLDHLKKQNLFDESVIAITGDHGEEFFEEGALFHGSHLNVYQTSVPILLKAGSWHPQTDVVTHMDIFPSIFHFITGKTELKALFDGQSIFTNTPRNPRIIVLSDGSNPPREFTLETENKRLRARFTKDPLCLELVEN